MAEFDAELCSDPLDRAVAIATGKAAEDWLTELRFNSRRLKTAIDFPVVSVRQCAAIEWGLGNDAVEILRYFVWLASGCLTTAFIMTQRNAALRRIESSTNSLATTALLPAIRTGEAFATVGISHLTTSRKHLSQPPLRATNRGEQWILNGYSPWVTGGAYADRLVVGAVANGVEGVSSEPLELLFAVDRHQRNVQLDAAEELLALSASSTGAIRFDEVVIEADRVLHGPVANVMNASVAKGGSGGAGGLQTTALAIGLAIQAIRYLTDQANQREDLRWVASEFTNQAHELLKLLFEAGAGSAELDLVSFRKSGNDLALKSTQAALAAAKGAGYVNNHDAGRWCTEALFFLVWSCPQSVIQSHMCSFVQ